MEPMQSAQIKFFPRNRSLAKAYPHNVAVKLPAKQEGTIIPIIFYRYFRNLSTSCVFTELENSQFPGIKAGENLYISAIDIRDVRKIHQIRKIASMAKKITTIKV